MKIILSETQLKRLYVNVIVEDVGNVKVYTDHDSVWNYRVNNGQWETSKKSNPDKWFSLSDPKFKIAVEKLDKKYPNARNNTETPTDSKPPIENETNDMKLLHPLKGKGVVTSRFGKRNINIPGASRDHKGIDIGVESGTPVYSPEYGLVLSATDTTPNGCGGFVKIEHGDFITKFCHLKKWVVKSGQDVKRGQLIGYTGGGKNDPYKGVSSNPHLHYEIRTKDNMAQNPENFHDNLT
jgi:murein DD-endopeptidase MepM/ murein hydrolase activator NlpD